jgi:hypothetical protein
VSRAFTALTAGKRSATSARSAAAQRAAQAAAATVESAVAQSAAAEANSALSLERLVVQLGPDLRAVYPFVLNFGLAGEVNALQMYCYLGYKLATTHLP